MFELEDGNGWTWELVGEHVVDAIERAWELVDAIGCGWSSEFVDGDTCSNKIVEKVSPNSSAGMYEWTTYYTKFHPLIQCKYYQVILLSPLDFVFSLFRR